MKCPYCRATDTEVYNSRPTGFSTQIWRRRRCLSCSRSFTTYETPDLGFIKVQGNSGRDQKYSRSKLYCSVYLSFDTTTNQHDSVDAVISTIESKLLDLQTERISSPQIASIVLSTLKHFNTAAFIRYLTEHKHLDSSAELRKELKKY